MVNEAKGVPGAENLDAIRLEAALGHKQELVRGFGLFSLTSLGIIIAKFVSCTPPRQGNFC